MLGFSEQLDARTIRSRAVDALADKMACEAGGYNIVEVDGELYYDSVTLSQGMSRRLVHAFEGAPLFPGASGTARVATDWDVFAPLPVHHNQFARFVDDIEDVEQLRNLPLWREFYGPQGIEDQVRGLFYADGQFIGYLAAWRGEDGAFSIEERAQLNRLADEFCDELVKADSIESARRGDASIHFIVDESGEVIYSSEAGAVWLTGERRDILPALLEAPDERRAIHGMRVTVEPLDHHGWRYVALRAADRPYRNASATLSASQKRIIELAAKGLSNAEIADATDLAPSTVKYHLREAYRVLGVESRVDLTVATKPT